MSFKCLYLTYDRLNFDFNINKIINNNTNIFGLPSFIIECYAYDNIYNLINFLKEINDKLNNIKIEKLLPFKYFGKKSMV